MAEEKEYEILPHEELQKLRDEVERIKRNPLHGQKVSDDLKASVDKLTTTMTNFINLLANTNDELVHQFEKTTIQAHFSKISDQNEQIAQAILTLADMIQRPAPEPAPQPVQSNQSSSGFPVPAPDYNQQISQPSQAPPRQQAQSQPNFGDMPSEYEDPFSSSSSQIPPMNNQSLDSNNPPLFNNPNNQHPLNSNRLDLPDLPPPPPKKKGLLGMFK